MSLRMLKSWCYEKVAQLVQLLRSERADWLLDQVMKKLLDERRVGLLAAGQVGRQAAGAGERHGLARLRVW